LSSREYIADEGSHYYKKEKHNAYVSCFFVEVRAIVKASSDVYINTDEEERCSISVHVSD
jgi:hypothetical protein